MFSPKENKTHVHIVYIPQFTVQLTYINELNALWIVFLNSYITKRENHKLTLVSLHSRRARTRTHTEIIKQEISPLNKTERCKYSQCKLNNLEICEDSLSLRTQTRSSVLFTERDHYTYTHHRSKTLQKSSQKQSHHITKLASQANYSIQHYW